jgi:hypothetical protein
MLQNAAYAYFRSADIIRWCDDRIHELRERRKREAADWLDDMVCRLKEQDRAPTITNFIKHKILRIEYKTPRQLIKIALEPGDCLPSYFYVLRDEKYESQIHRLRKIRNLAQQSIAMVKISDSDMNIIKPYDE